MNSPSPTADDCSKSCSNNRKTISFKQLKGQICHLDLDLMVVRGHLLVVVRKQTFFSNIFKAQQQCLCFLDNPQNSAGAVFFV